MSNEAQERDRWFLGTFMRVLLSGEDSGGKMTVIEQKAKRGFSPPLHVHETEDGTLYVLAGRVTVQLGDRRSTLSPGEAAFLPKGVPHTFRIDSDEAHLLEVSTPGGFERFVMANSVAAAQPVVPAEPGFIDPAALATSAAFHRAPLVGPPLPAADS